MEMVCIVSHIFYLNLMALSILLKYKVSVLKFIDVVDKLCILFYDLGPLLVGQLCKSQFLQIKSATRNGSNSFMIFLLAPLLF